MYNIVSSITITMNLIELSGLYIYIYIRLIIILFKFLKLIFTF